MSMSPTDSEIEHQITLDRRDATSFYFCKRILIKLNFNFIVKKGKCLHCVTTSISQCIQQCSFSAANDQGMCIQHIHVQSTSKTLRFTCTVITCKKFEDALSIIYNILKSASKRCYRVVDSFRWREGWIGKSGLFPQRRWGGGAEVQKHGLLNHESG